MIYHLEQRSDQSPISSDLSAGGSNACFPPPHSVSSILPLFSPIVKQKALKLRFLAKFSDVCMLGPLQRCFLLVSNVIHRRDRAPWTGGFRWMLTLLLPSQIEGRGSKGKLLLCLFSQQSYPSWWYLDRPYQWTSSWLNVAEIELSLLTWQCLHRRLPDRLTLQQHAQAWYERRNAKQKSVDWQFTSRNARVKLKRLSLQFEG